MNPKDIIEKFYKKDSELYRILVTHSESVAKYATKIVDKHPELGADRRLVFEGAMLHDIGIIKTSAPAIHCSGKYDYICHGYLGREMLESLGLNELALFCEHHTGAGMTKEEIELRELPLPHRDMLPTTVEEEIVCYADKFFSKTKNLREAKTFEKALASIEKHGEGPKARFLAMHERFKIE